MTVLIAADLITFSGVGNYIRNLATRLTKLGHKVIVASPINDLKIGCADDGLTYIKLDKINRNPIRWFKNVRIIARIIKEYHIDVIHANHRMVSFIVSLYNKFHKHVPTVWIAHTVPYPTSLIKRIFAYYGDRSIAISSEAKWFMHDTLKIPNERIDLVLNGVDESKLQPLSNDEKLEIEKRYGIDSGKFVFCIHGRIDHVKGIDLVVDAIRELPDEYRSRFVVLVSGVTENNEYYNELQKSIKNYGLENNFKFIGWCDSRIILGVSDMMLAPSRREGFHLAVAEAFFMRVAVVRTKVGGYLDMKNACVGIEPENCDMIKNRIIEFLDNPGIYNDMVDRAYSFASKNCTLDKMTEFTIMCYERALSWSEVKNA